MFSVSHMNDDRRLEGKKDSTPPKITSDPTLTRPELVGALRTARAHDLTLLFAPIWPTSLHPRIPFDQSRFSPISREEDTGGLQHGTAARNP